LFLHCLIFNSFSNSFLGDVFNIFILINLRNIFSYIFDCVIISDFLLFRDILCSLYGFVFNDRFLIRHVFDTRLALDAFMES